MGHNDSNMVVPQAASQRLAGGTGDPVGRGYYLLVTGKHAKNYVEVP